MFINIHDLREILGDKKGEDAFNFMRRSTVSGVNRRAEHKYKRGGKTFTSVKLMLHYEVEKVLEYCTNQGKGLTHSEDLAGVCRAVELKNSAENIKK